MYKNCPESSSFIDDFLDNFSLSNKLICKNSENNLRKDSIIKTDVIYKIFTQNILNIYINKFVYK